MINTKPFVKILNGKSVAVLGLGLSGFSTGIALIKSGAKVCAWDEDEEKRYIASQSGIEISNFDDIDLKEFGALVLSPGIPLHYPKPHNLVIRAKDAGIPIIGDIEIFHHCAPKNKTIGVTGTNGKSTTTALIHHILSHAKIDAVMGGNIGKPVLDLNIKNDDTIIVLELSSYQLDLCKEYHPNVSILLNITPDHLERHGGMDGYIASKERIFEGQGIAICNLDDKPCQDVFDRVSKSGFRKVFGISTNKQISQGIYIKDGILFDSMDDNSFEVGSVQDIHTLRGIHNHQNICAAYAVCKSLGLSSDKILNGIKSYGGLPHRQFLTRVINGVAYVNDSKATNADAAIKAIACYKNIYLIAGGRAKEGGLNGIEKYKDHIKHIFLIGEAADDFAKWAKMTGIDHTKSGSLDVAVLEAHYMAQSMRGIPGASGTVLLSPACASWDQFKNFEHRGDVFMDLVKSLSDEVLK